MAKEPSVTYYDVTEVRCALCRFSLEKGELVVARVLSHNLPQQSCPDIDDTRLISRFKFDPVEMYDDFPGPDSRAKSSRCRVGGLPGFVFHSGCFELNRAHSSGTLHSLTVSSTLLAATEYSFQPSSDEPQRRFDRIWRRLQHKLSPETAVYLPAEIRGLIAKFLVYEYAGFKTQELALQGTSPSESLIDLTRNVYAEYLELDGIPYIKNIWNSKSDGDNSKILLLDTRNENPIYRVFIGDDHLGVRSVLFASSPSMWPRPRPGLWWRDISSEVAITKIRAKTDVSGTHRPAPVELTFP